MKILTVFECKKNNQCFWTWRDEFTHEHGETFLTKKKALKNRPEKSLGSYNVYSIFEFNTKYGVYHDKRISSYYQN